MMISSIFKIKSLDDRWMIFTQIKPNFLKYILFKKKKLHFQFNLKYLSLLNINNLILTKILFFSFKKIKIIIILKKN
jgi:hypothetical protein